MAEALERYLDMTRPHPLRPGSLQDGADFVGQGGTLQQVRSLRAGIQLDAFAFAQGGQSLQGLADEDDAPLGFLLLREQVGEFVLGGFVRFLILGRRRHGVEDKHV